MIERLTAKWHDAPVKAVPVADGELVRYEDYLFLWKALFNIHQVLKFVTDLQLEPNERALVRRALARGKKALELMEGQDEGDTEPPV